jgi:hypothetical protein
VITILAVIAPALKAIVCGKAQVHGFRQHSSRCIGQPFKQWCFRGVSK